MKNSVMTAAAPCKTATGRAHTTKPKNRAQAPAKPPAVESRTIAYSPRLPAIPEIASRRYRAIAQSAMNRDLSQIAKAAERLREMIESFEDEHGETTALDIFAEAGLPEWEEGQDQTHLHWDLETLRDVKGFAWALAYFTDVVLPYGV